MPGLDGGTWIHRSPFCAWYHKCYLVPLELAGARVSWGLASSELTGSLESQEPPGVTGAAWSPQSCQVHGCDGGLCSQEPAGSHPIETTWNWRGVWNHCSRQVLG